MATTLTTNKNFNKQGSGDNAGTWDVQLNANFDTIDKALAGTQSYSLTATDATATQTELQNLRIKVTGTLTANVAVKIPVGVAGLWLVSNATTGAFTLTVKQATGDTGVVVVQAKSSIIYSDGTNCIYGVDIVTPATDLSGYMQRAQNLADVSSAIASRANLGLGSVATLSETVVRSIPQNPQAGFYVLAATDNGKHISITSGGVRVDAGIHAVNDVITIFNNSGSPQTITQGTSVTMRQAGTANIGNRTLAQYGLATVLCVATNVFVISGAGLT